MNKEVHYLGARDDVHCCRMFVIVALVTAVFSCYNIKFSLLIAKDCEACASKKPVYSFIVVTRKKKKMLAIKLWCRQSVTPYRCAVRRRDRL